MAKTLQNVEFKEIPFADLIFMEDNPRYMTEQDGEKLARDIKKDPNFFRNRPTLVNLKGGKYYVYAGTMRAKTAHEKLQWQKIPCNVEHDLPEKTMRERAILDNTHRGQWDTELLSGWEFSQGELFEMGVPAFAVGWETEGGVPNNALNSEAKEDDFEAPPIEQIQTDIQLGDMFQIGEHRLLCGDSTKLEDVERVMGGDKIDICVTSPPYNSQVGGFKSDYSGQKKSFYVDDTDRKTSLEYVNFCKNVLQNISVFCRSENSPIVWNVMYNAKSRNEYGQVLFANDIDFSVKETICWDKTNGFPTASKGILSRNWELVFVLSKGDKYFTTQGDNEVRWAKWTTKPPRQEETHGATYPVDLVEIALKNFSTELSFVYEPFCGSGTTMVAAHQLNRKCYGIEISPQYCQVIIDRMKKLDPEIEVKKLQ